jgi:hypothetical protein
VVMYATPADLASYLKQDLDTSTATLLLQIASELFAQAAHTRFEATTVTYQTQGSDGNVLVLPFQPIISVSAVRIAGVAVTDYTRIGQIMYRASPRPHRLRRKKRHEGWLQHLDRRGGGPVGSDGEDDPVCADAGPVRR